MRRRLFQIFGFLISTLGWVFVSCTMAMDYWRITSIGGKGGSWIIKAASYWSSLWRDCYTDTTAITNCRDYDVLWGVTPYVQGVRGLLMVGMSFGFLAAIFCFIGMECTYIGGSEKAKDKLVFTGAIFHFVGGVSDIAGYCLYTNSVARTAFAHSVERGVLRYNIGTPILLGFVACFLIIIGAILYAITVYQVLFPQRVFYTFTPRPYMVPQTYMGSRNRTTHYGPSYYGLTRQSRSSGYTSSSRASDAFV